MASTIALQRLAPTLLATALISAALTAPADAAPVPPAARAAVAASPDRAYAADPSGPADPSITPDPSITSGPNGKLVWTQLILNPTNGAVDGGYLRSSSGHSYIDLADPEAALRDPEWSPDGTRIAYWAYGATSGRQGIWAVDHPFSNPRPVRVTTGYYDSDPAWSPDGTKIAFVRSQGDNGIYVVDADGGGTPYQILRGSFFGEDLSWSPDGTRIAFANYSGSPFTSPLHVYVMDIDGGTPVDIGLGSEPSWSPDGTRLAFQFPFSASDIDIGLMNPDGTDRYGVIGAIINETEPSWSPDGTKIAYLTSSGINTYDVQTRAQVLVAGGSNFESTTWGADQPACQGRPATISGTAGNDVLRGSRGIDVIHGLGGNDTILGKQGQDVICGGAGTDTVSYAGQSTPARAYIGEIDPQSGASDLIAGDVENLFGGSGPDLLIGDERTNRLEGLGGDDVLNAGPGADAIVGGGGDDTLVGDDGNDTLAGGGGDDALRGGEGIDTLDGGLDSDVIAGGPGVDTVDYGVRTIGVSVTIGGGGTDDGSREDGTEGERDRVRGSVENVNGGEGPDVLVGNEVGNQLKGDLGVDELRGGDGRDLLRANDGVRDRVIDCGDGTDADALRDSIDPAAISCP